MNKFVLQLACISSDEREPKLRMRDVRLSIIYCLLYSSLPSNVLKPAPPASLFYTVLVSRIILSHLRDNEKDHTFHPHYLYDSISLIGQNARHAPLIEQPTLICSPWKNWLYCGNFSHHPPKFSPSPISDLLLPRLLLFIFKTAFPLKTYFCRPLHEHLATSLAINYMFKVSKTSIISK